MTRNHFESNSLAESDFSAIFEGFFTLKISGKDLGPPRPVFTPMCV